MRLPELNLDQIRVRPEERLLLATARVELRDEDRAVIDRTLSLAPDWKLLIELARTQRLSGFLHSHLIEGDWGGRIPDSVTRELQNDYLLVLAKGIYFDREIAALLQTLKDDSIPVILLKGAALRRTIYDDPGVRPMSDIDILVPEEETQRAQALAIALGYSPTGSPEERAEAETSGRHLPRLQGVGKPTAIEVHRHIVSLDSPSQFDISGFWDRSVDFELQGKQARKLSTEDQLVHLSLGFMMDRQFKSASALGQLADIDAVVERSHPGVDWDLLVSILTGYGLMAPVGCALTLSRLLLGTPIPADTAFALWPDGTTERDLSLFVETRVLASGSFVVKGLVPPGSSYTLSAMARAIGRKLVPERDAMVGKYGDSARGARGLRFYAVRLFEGLRIGAGGVRHPGGLRDDFVVDQWMHSLFDRP